MISTVKRVGRYMLLLENPNECIEAVMGKIMKAILDLPQLARTSITFNRGTKIAALQTRHRLNVRS